MTSSVKNVVNLPIPRRNIVAKATETRGHGRYRTCLPGCLISVLSFEILPCGTHGLMAPAARL